ncbi:ATP-binding protein, partial [Solemya velum gill symbiont]
SSLLRRLCDSLQRVYRDKGVTVSLNCTEGLLASCDEKLFFEVAGNLLDNAFKWTESSVTVRCEKQGGSMIAIVITDDGPGFGESDPSIYLQRGVRADERVAGQGIGLSVAQLLVTEAGGELKLENAPAGGARVTLFLPAVSQN